MKLNNKKAATPTGKKERPLFMEPTNQGRTRRAGKPLLVCPYDTKKGEPMQEAKEREIQLNIDAVKYTDKETAKSDMGNISKRLRSVDSIRRTWPAGLRDCVKMGLTFCPAVLTGGTVDNWQQQEVICIDVDNEDFKTKKPLEDMMQPEDALQILKDQELSPMLLYHTFSSSAEWPRYRIVFVLSEPLTDPEETKQLATSLRCVLESLFFGATDPSATDLNRMYLGGKEDCIIYFDENNITDVEKLRELPKPTEKKEEPPKKERPTGSYHNELNRLEDQLSHDINNFDLVSYLQSEGSSLKRRGNTKYMNPCPICGGRDDFQVFRNSWVCYGAKGADKGRNGRRPGGSIIDLLEITRGINKGKALEVFKYDLMHYDRKEWGKAYAKSKEAEEQERKSQANRERIRKLIEEDEGGAHNE